MSPRLQEFVANRVKCFAEPELGTIKSGKLARAAAGYLSRVEVELDDGSVVHGRALPFPGHPRAPFSDAEIAQKLVANAEPFADGDRIDQIVAALRTFETVAAVTDFTELLAFDARKARINPAA
jgi:2-methylcitrate dehydratase